jgi:hypothetical protein
MQRVKRLGARAEEPDMHASASPTEQVAALAGRFTTAGFPHAFGGAVALCAHLRGQALDRIDLHVFLAPREAEAVLVRLAVLGVAMDRAEVLKSASIRGRVELAFGATPLALVFGVDDLHRLAQPRVRRVPFAERWIYVLSAEDLVLAKALAEPGAAAAQLEKLVDAFGADLDLAYLRQAFAQLGVSRLPQDPVLQRLLTARGD